MVRGARGVSDEAPSEPPSVPLSQAVEHEARCQAVNFESRDTAEALAAFSEKRQPTYVGR